MFKKMLKTTLNQFNLDIVKYDTKPVNSLLGLTNYTIKTIFDIGANKGQSAKKYIKIFDGATIFCFEPLPEAFIALKSWANSQKNVEAFNLALGNENGIIDFIFHTEHTPSSSLLQTTELCKNIYPKTCAQRIITVKMEKLDDMRETLDIKKDILVKMDVQGFEIEVIRGGFNLLKESIACILEICIQPLYFGQSEVLELFTTLGEIGFTYAGNISQHYDNNGFVIFIDAVFLNKNII